MDPVGKQRLTVTAEAEDKIYDGTADAVISLEITEGKIDGDDVTAVGQEHFQMWMRGPKKRLSYRILPWKGRTNRTTS